MNSVNNRYVPRKAEKKDSRKREQITALKQSYALRNQNLKTTGTFCVIFVINDNSSFLINSFFLIIRHCSTKEKFRLC